MLALVKKIMYKVYFLRPVRWIGGKGTCCQTESNAHNSCEERIYLTRFSSDLHKYILTPEHTSQTHKNYKKQNKTKKHFTLVNY